MEKVAREVIAWNPPVDWVKDAMESAGTTIGSVHFNKRKNGELRKMSYRLHVTNPKVAAKPKGLTPLVCSICHRADCPQPKFLDTPVKSKKTIDKANNQMTVLDANKVVRDKDGVVLGRGAWRTVPLENVVRIKNKGVTYLINRT